MTEPEEVRPRRRRTRQEVQRLVGECGTSGLSRGEFCRIHGMTLSTLQRGLKRERTEPSDIQRDGKRLVRVKVIGGSGTADREGLCAMAVVLAKGRRECVSKIVPASVSQRPLRAFPSDDHFRPVGISV
jgi:hypothetical protein